ncbi:lipopolysaccharide transport periplasmic protein LptA [Aliidiomarina iranensis]|uniref:Lipopolysaccharide transport periplasmic protein LptA n=1 Tax=Aliidiomarina iranensis TaxID=1434071 RepID=A0A432W2Q1_9GAMM|nr:lipopolysaccharide transport periplasmic protein LptA [Aliidiomarina iranensis]RUO23488.1 lipopolysaccharide transport periplasmic protein LptA [Aliidiomarina iranensis]
MLKPFTILALLALSLASASAQEPSALEQEPSAQEQEPSAGQQEPSAQEQEQQPVAEASENARGTTLARDFAAPIRILADNDLLDLAENVYRASGNVRITQGSMRITAHTLSVTGFETNTGEDELFILEGNGEGPATYEQEIEPGMIVNAYANRIEYDATNRILKLVGAAELTQEGNSVRAENITYYVETMQVSATRGEEQVETIFRPRSRTENEQN